MTVLHEECQLKRKEDVTYCMLSKEIDGYKFVRTAERNAVAAGSRMYVRCSHCGDMVWLQPDEKCNCGHVSVETVSGRCTVSGGRGSVELYYKYPEAKEMEWQPLPAIKRRFRLSRMDIITIILFIIAVLLVLYIKPDRKSVV